MQTQDFRRMNTMRNLFICKTPYQLIVITQLVLTQYGNDMNDLLICDTIANVESLSISIREANIFNSVEIHRSMSVQNRVSKRKYYLIAGKQLLHIKKDVFGFQTKYDRLFICNLSFEETLIYRELKYTNRNLKKYMFEDGFATYTEMYGRFVGALVFNKSVLHNIKALCKRFKYGVFNKVDGLYVFSPDLLDWHPAFAVFAIPKIDPEDRLARITFNKIFGLQKLEDRYEEKYVFFEESYYADGNDVGDVELVNRIAEVTGKNNLFVKIHPRNPKNRFHDLGYKTNVNTFVPWEIIALNIDLKEKVLITIASGSALTSLVNTSVSPKAIFMLMNSREFRNKKLTPSADTLNRVASCYPENIIMPEDMESFLRLIAEKYEQ